MPQAEERGAGKGGRPAPPQQTETRSASSAPSQRRRRSVLPTLGATSMAAFR